MSDPSIHARGRAGLPDRGAWWRRPLSVAVLHIAALVASSLAPVALPSLLLVDLLTRSRLARTRFGLFILWWLAVEVGAVWAAIACGCCLRGARLCSVDHALQRWWSGTLWRGLVRLYGVELEVEGLDELLPGPVVLLVRHASTADTLLPAVLVANPHRFRLRYLLKRELRWDPCIDIVGQRLPNHFVDRRPRTAAERATQLEAIGRLARGLDRRSGVVIYPEGTRFSVRRRQRRLEAARRRGDDAELARLQRFEHVFPPHPGGLLRVLAEAPDADLVFCAHTGFESVTRLPDLWRGSLVGARVRLGLWRVPAATLPVGDEARAAWLTAQWKRVDDFVAGA